MYALSCTDGFKYPGSEPTYITDIIPVSAGLAAVGSDQSLSIFNPLRLNQGPLKKVQTNHGNISCAEVFSVGNSIVATAGENGTVSLWDLRSDAANTPVLQIGTPDEGPGLLSLACSEQTNTLAAGTELANHQASILLWDLRSPHVPKIHYDEVHSDDVTELSFHPANPHLLLTGSTDGLVNVCDTRITDEDEVVIAAFNHGSVHRAGFLNETEVYAVSHDERFALYDMGETVEKGSPTLDLGDIRKVVDCQYLCNVIPKVTGAGAVIGAGTQDQELFRLIHLSKNGASWSLDSETVVGLPGAHGSEIVRSFCFVDEQQVVFTAGEDSCIKAWRPSV
ncbi:WD40-repeat-containing domain protein [Neurospora intermedia]|uniref:WD40-repeat-containing domain protein n=1 Tax=Neurospora intermedia TaxID=5142 RepID=A0ABR3D8I8_NEUIN